LGYRADGGELVPVDSEQATVPRIGELHADGAILRAICDNLEDEGHRIKRGRPVAPADRRPHRPGGLCGVAQPASATSTPALQQRDDHLQAPGTNAFTSAVACWISVLPLWMSADA